MVNGLFSQTNYQGLKKMLDATVLRHEAIASNIANLETPNYKRIDVESSFSSQLGRAVQAGKVNEITRLQPHLALDKTALASNRDGNSVQLDKELVHLQQNSMAHNMQTQFVSSTMMKLRAAIQGRV
jgi:flagellar basal-body rod protein FlgB